MFWAVCAVQSDTRFSVARGDWIYAVKKVEIYKDWPNKNTGGKEKHAQEKMLHIRSNYQMIFDRSGIKKKESTRQRDGGRATQK